MSYIGAGQNKYTVFPLENYTFGNKSPKIEKQRNLDARFKHLKEKYAQQGMRRTVDGVALVHKHNTIHVLILQANQSFFKLPGGRLRPGEDEIGCLQRKLTRNLGPEKNEELAMRWQIADCLGRFYRPNFETLLYPYCPTHIERPKEMKKLFLVNLPERAFFTVPRNLKLMAIPLFELYDHAAKYGPVISTLPTLLSRLHFNIAHSGSGAVPRPLNPALSAPPPANGVAVPSDNGAQGGRIAQAVHQPPPQQQQHGMLPMGSAPLAHFSGQQHAQHTPGAGGFLQQHGSAPMDGQPSQMQQHSHQQHHQQLPHQVHQQQAMHQGQPGQQPQHVHGHDGGGYGNMPQGGGQGHGQQGYGGPSHGY